MNRASFNSSSFSVVKINEGGEDEDGGIEFGDMGDLEGVEDEKSGEDENSESSDEETDSDEDSEEDTRPKLEKNAQQQQKHKHEQKRGGKREADNAAIDDVSHQLLFISCSTLTPFFGVFSDLNCIRGRDGLIACKDVCLLN